MARAMKDSGIEWLGDIPADWSVGRIKYNYYLKGRIGWQGLKADEFIDEGAFLVTGTDFMNGRVNWDTCYHITQERYNEAPEIHVQEKDLLITKDGTVGKVAYIDSKPEQVSLNSHLLIMRPLNEAYLNRFLFWVIQSPVFVKFFLLSQNGTVMASLSQEKISNFSFAFPPLDEQQRIVDFLDSECARIDSIVEKTRASIEEYKKLKQSIITQAVTKGIRPNRLMKDSGIKWLGQIPADWEIHQIKNDFQIFSGATPKSEVVENWDGDIVWITPADYKTTDRYILQGKRNISKVGYNSCGTMLIPSGSIIFSKRAPIGTVAIAAVELCTNQGCLSCVPKANTDSGYFCYVMSAFTEQFNLFGTGTTFKEISYNDFRSFKVPFPPLDEQKEIAEYLDEKTVAIDSLIAKKNRLVTELESLKKSLIFEYVTGKKEVPT